MCRTMRVASRFWAQSVEALPNAEEWCVGGGFNMLEGPDDKRDGSQTKSNYDPWHKANNLGEGMYGIEDS